jgi:hypothetical protein
MKRFVEGVDRGQSTLFPECVEDWISEDNQFRVIDVLSMSLIWLCSGSTGSNLRRPVGRRIIRQSC